VGAQADPLVGRNAELARIATFLEAELPGAIVLEGEAGIGKTRVWEESVRTASASGCGVPKTCSHFVIMAICRRNPVVTPHADDAEKLRG
jgi:ATP-dependent Clp protease ATP-binding subunit ClpA